MLRQGGAKIDEMSGTEEKELLAAEEGTCDAAECGLPSLTESEKNKSEEKTRKMLMLVRPERPLSTRCHASQNSLQRVAVDGDPTNCRTGARLHNQLSSAAVLSQETNVHHRDL